MITKQDMDKLYQAINLGMVTLDHYPTPPTATIYAPPNPQSLSDEDWLPLLQASSELRTTLEELNYHVLG